MFEVDSLCFSDLSSQLALNTETLERMIAVLENINHKLPEVPAITKGKKHGRKEN